MPIISPEAVSEKSEKAYHRFLGEWIRGTGDEFFPYRIRTKLTPDVGDVKGTIAAIEQLCAKSKEQRGWGYTVHREQIRSRDFGNNRFPKAITIDTLDDLLRLPRKVDDFAATKMVADRIRSEFPQLDDWVVTSVRSLSAIAEPLDGLIRVAKFFINSPWPDCYARQIPVPVDTKFIDRHSTILRQWLDILLPDSAIDVNEKQFARRFGLRDGQPHCGVRLLDPQLADELRLPYEELSLPLQAIAALPVHNMTVVIVENNLNLLTLPTVPRGIGIRGAGKAVTRLERIKWLAVNRVIYWGDIDVDGFLILSSLRNLFPDVESVMMDPETMQQHEQFVVDGNGTQSSTPTNLTPSEAATFSLCSDDNRRLEQEKILQPHVDRVFLEMRL